MAASRITRLLTRAPSAGDIVLRVQVFQGPAMQCEYRTKVNRTTRVKLGKSENCELNLPFASFANDILLFAVHGKYGARVLLDPRIDGFVSDGHRFGSVRDFIAPRGALKELASISEPLQVPIPLGSRGALEIGAYTVVFRVEKIKPVAAKAKIIGAPKAPFALPESHSMIERGGFFLALLSTILVTIPAVQWLNKAPISQFRSIADLSPFLASDIIHPDHFQILPWVYGSEFQPNKIVEHSLIWVDELKKKWQAEDEGRRYDSNLQPLRGFSLPQDTLERRRVWQAALDDQWNAQTSVRDKAPAGNFLKGQSSYSPFRVVVSGGESGSLPERTRARIERLTKTREAIVSLIETEHVYLKNHFKTMDADINQIFDPPKEPGLFFRLAEKSFSDERDNFHAAESFAALARQRQKIADDEELDDAEIESGAEPLVWAADSLTFPHVLSSGGQPVLLGSEAELFRNAKLAMGSIAPPPAPKLLPKIDMKEVEVYVRGRSAEVKSCYDGALDRNPRLGGQVVWRWTIAESGRLAKAQVASSNIKDSQFIKCLEKKIKAWSFPRPVNGAITISFPFRFVVRENLDTLERISR